MWAMWVGVGAAWEGAAGVRGVQVAVLGAGEGAGLAGGDEGAEAVLLRRG